MRLTRWMLVASVWLLSVGVVAGVSWYAINSAGRQVRILGDAPVRWKAASPLPEAQAEALSPTPGAVSTTSTPSPTETVTPTVGEPAATGPSAGTPSPSDRRTRPQTSPGPRPTPALKTSSTPAPRPSTSGRTRSQTTETRGGSVTVTCSASDPIDYLVRPDQGWSASGKRSGPNEAEIKISRAGSTIEVHATCVAGKPKTTVEDHGGGDD